MCTCRLSPVALLVGLVVTAAASHPAQAETLLRWKFEAGQKTRMVITQEIKMKMFMRENPVLTTTTTTMDFDWEVTSLDEQGVATRTLTAVRIQMKVTDQSKKGTIYFDNELGQFVTSESISRKKESTLGQEMVLEMEEHLRIESKP